MSKKDRDLSESFMTNAESLLPFKLMIDSTDEMIAFIDANYKYQAVNLAFAESHGLTTDDIIDRHVREIIGEELFNTIIKTKYDACLEGDPLHYSSWYDLRGRGRTYIESTIRPFIDQDGNVRGLIESNRDLTERKSAEETLLRSENRFRSIVNSSPLGMHIYQLFGDGELKLIGANPAADKILGINHDELVGLTIEEAFPSSKETELPQIYKKIAAIGGTWEDQQIVYEDNRISGVFEVNAFQNSPGMMTAMFSDTTVKRQAEFALRESEERYRALFEQSGDAIVFEDENEIIYDLNERTSEILGYSRDELIGMKTSDLQKKIPPDKNTKLPIYEHPEKGLISPIERTIVTRDGIEKTLELNIVPMKTSNEKFFISIARDITERKEADKLQNAIYRIAQLVDRVDGLDELYSAVHDIISELMYAENFYIALFDAEKQIVSFPYFHDKVDEASPPQKLGKGLTEYVLKTGESLLVDMESHHELIKSGKAELIGKPSAIWLGVPLKIENRTIGVMALQHYEDITAYGSKEQKVLEFVSSQIAQAINQKRKVELLSLSEEKYRSLFEDDLTGDYISTPDGQLLTCNKAFARLFGFNSVEDALSFSMVDLYENPEDRKEYVSQIKSQKRLEFYEKELRTHDGRIIHVIENAIGTFDTNNDLIQIRGYLIDNTERKALEQQLLQAQKMESIGRLAGGIAHDFNNLLTAISGNTELAMLSLDDRDPMREDLDEVKAAAERAAELTNQLLAFSRKQTLQPRIINLNDSILNIDNMLNRLIGEDIELITITDKNLWNVEVDPNQIEQVIINLAINSRDAMQDGGKLTIETTNSEIDSEYAKLHQEFRAGKYVLISVSDSGSGIDASIRDKIFDPFFTTKDVGKGTGLGLSTVYGIVKQSAGFINLYSEPGEGTTFKIYLPKVDEDPISDDIYTDTTAIPTGTERVLLVEDEEGVRSLAKRVLIRLGYTVFDAESGDIAIKLCDSLDSPVDIVVTDVVMPKVGGKEFASMLKEKWNNIKIVFMSGYTENALTNNGVLLRDVKYLQKPFRPMELAQIVRKVLDE